MKYFSQLRRLHRNELKRIENVDRKREAEAVFYDREAEEFLADCRETDLREMVDEFRREVACREEVVEYHKLPFGFRCLGDLGGRRVLDCCCGMGVSTVVLAERGARVSGIDISAKMIEIAGRNLELHGVEDRAEALLMSAEHLDFDDGTFDAVFGFVALHHLQPELAAREASRVLKPGGRAVYIEPASDSALLRFVRALVPVRCNESPGGGSMTMDEFELVGRSFSGMQIWHFELLARLDRVLPASSLVEVLHRLDSKALGRFPWLRKYGRFLVVEYAK